MCNINIKYFYYVLLILNDCKMTQSLELRQGVNHSQHVLTCYFRTVVCGLAEIWTHNLALSRLLAFPSFNLHVGHLHFVASTLLLGVIIIMI